MLMLPWFSAKILCCFLMQCFHINPVWSKFCQTHEVPASRGRGGLFRTQEEASGISSLVENPEGVAVLHYRGVLAVETEHSVLGLACHRKLPLPSASSKNGTMDCQWSAGTGTVSGGASHEGGPSAPTAQEPESRRNHSGTTPGAERPGSRGGSRCNARISSGLNKLSGERGMEARSSRLKRGCRGLEGIQ